MNKETNKDKEYLSTYEAAKLLNVAVSTVQMWTDNGMLDAWVTAGGHRRIAKTSAEMMLKLQNTSSTTKVSKPVSILVVEDKEPEQRLYVKNFDAWDMDIDFHIFSDGYSALIKLGEVSPRIIIMDLIMPKIDGFEMINAIRKNSDLNSCLIISVSALTDVEIQKHGGLPEEVLSLKRPISFNELQVVVKNIINEC